MVELNIFGGCLWCPWCHNRVTYGNDPYKRLILPNDSSTNNKANLPNAGLARVLPWSGNHNGAWIDRPFGLFQFLREGESLGAPTGPERGRTVCGRVRGQQQLVPHLSPRCCEDAVVGRLQDQLYVWNKEVEDCAELLQGLCLLWG